MAIQLAALHPQAQWVAGDFEDELVWEALRKFSAGLLLSADVIEHLEQPRHYLDRLCEIARNSGSLLLLSTPDRSRLGSAPYGPPENPRHVREWTSGEMMALLSDAGFVVLERRHLLPRSYSANLTELKRFSWRVLHGRPVPDHKTCMAFLCRVAAAHPETAGHDQRPEPVNYGA
jgi:hypothetical protein